MRILIDILHPAHVHFFRYAIEKFEKQGHEIFVTARDIEVAHKLLINFNIPFVSTGKIGKSYMGLMWELFTRNIKISRIVRKNKIDIMMGISGPSIAMVGFFKRKPRIIFSDTEVNGIANIIAFRLATTIYTPMYFEKNLGKKHVRYDSFQELTYLNPKYFYPDPEIPKKYGFEPFKYSMMRFSAWKASHDVKHYGISSKMKMKIVEELENVGKILISAEGSEIPELQPYLFKAKPEELLSFLAFAKIVVSDTSTVTTEAALLGVPVVRCNSLVGTDRGAAGNMKALEDAGLIFNYIDEKQAFEKIKELILDKETKAIWEERLQKFIEDREDTVEVIIKSIEPYQK